MSYSPNLMRWLEKDPLEFVDSLNSYQYMGVSPVTNLDPEGTKICVDQKGRAELFTIVKILAPAATLQGSVVTLAGGGPRGSAVQLVKDLVDKNTPFTVKDGRKTHYANRIITYALDPVSESKAYFRKRDSSNSSPYELRSLDTGRINEGASMAHEMIHALWEDQLRAQEPIEFIVFPSPPSSITTTRPASGNAGPVVVQMENSSADYEFSTIGMSVVKVPINYRTRQVTTEMFVRDYTENNIRKELGDTWERVTYGSRVRRVEVQDITEVQASVPSTQGSSSRPSRGR